MASSGQPSTADLPRAAPHGIACGTSVRPSKRGPRRALVLVLLHVALLAHIAHWKVSGTSLTPLEPSEAGETLTLGYVNAGFILLVVSVLATLVLGRFFCGWACHVVAIQDACAWLLGKLGLRPQPVRSRLLVFVPLFAAFNMFAWPTIERWFAGAEGPTFSWHLTTSDLWERFPGLWMTVLTFVVDGALIVWFLGAKGFCTYGCPYGALYGIADRFAKGRIRVTDACEGCGHCTATCTSNVRVHEEVALHRMVVDPGCMKCMDCVSVCPKDALYFGFGPLRAADPVPVKRAPRHDFTWPEEFALAGLFGLALLAFRGLYDGVPFLLAIGLAVLVAAAGVTLWRLVTRPSMRLQHAQLKASGRLTAPGYAAIAVLPLYMAFTAHSGFVRFHEHRGDALLRAAATYEQGSDARIAALLASAEHLHDARRFGLYESDELHNRLGQIYLGLDRIGDAEHHLREAAARGPKNRAPRVLLAQLLVARDELDEAAHFLDEVLELEPLDVNALRTLHALLSRDPAHAHGLALLDRALAARGDDL